MAIPAREMRVELFALRLMIRGSTSNAVRKRNRTKPTVAVRLRYGSETSGKRLLLKFGMRPMTVGPRITPPMTSAMTWKEVPQEWVNTIHSGPSGASFRGEVKF